VGEKVAGNLALALGEAVHILFDIAEDVAFHGCIFRPFAL
jgi:hypothetical protein